MKDPEEEDVSEQSEICPICNGEGYIQKIMSSGGFNCYKCNGKGEI